MSEEDEEVFYTEVCGVCGASWNIKMDGHTRFCECGEEMAIDMDSTPLDGALLTFEERGGRSP